MITWQFVTQRPTWPPVAEALQMRKNPHCARYYESPLGGRGEKRGEKQIDHRCLIAL